MRNDVLQNYLVQFCKCLADNFDNLKFQDASKVLIFRPPNSSILHCHGKCGHFTLYLKGNDMKIPNLENLEFYTCTFWDHNAKIFNYGRESWVSLNEKLCYKII